MEKAFRLIHQSVPLLIVLVPTAKIIYIDWRFVNFIILDSKIKDEVIEIITFY